MNSSPSLDHWSIVFLLASAQGVFLFFLFLFNKKWKNKKNRILATVVLLFSIMLLYYVAYWTNYLSIWPEWVNIVGGASLAIVPLFYCYVKLHTREVTTNRIMWHMIPFFFFLTFMVVATIFTNYLSVIFFPTKVLFFQKVHSIVVLIQNLQLIIYTVAAWRVILGSVRKNKWLQEVGIAFSIYSFGYILYYVLVWTDLLKVEYDYGISATMAFFIYFIGYKGYLSPQYLEMELPATKYAKSLLSKPVAHDLVRKIVQHIESRQSYKNSDYKLTTLAEEIGLTSHVISQALNQYLKKSFSELINFYRITEAKRQLKTDSDRPIISIAYAVGFNNKVSFNNSFKKLVGVTPGQFKANHLEGSEEKLELEPQAG